MREDIRQRFIFWIIGFGCGIVLSATIMVGLVFNTKEYKAQLASEFSSQENLGKLKESTELDNKEITKEIEDAQGTEPLLKDKPISSNPTEESLKPGSEEIKGSPITSDSALKAEKKAEELQTVTVNIPKQATAKKICELLQRQGVIEDAEDFSKYIVEKRKTKYLKDGKIVFPIGAEYDVILGILITK